MNTIKKKTTEIAEKNDNIIGIVCQNKMTNKKLNIVPGISINTKTDNKGQIYNTPNEKQFADIFVIGRSIYLSNNPLITTKKILNII